MLDCVVDERVVVVLDADVFAVVVLVDMMVVVVSVVVA